jgi:hypothetical protein
VSDSQPGRYGGLVQRKADHGSSYTQACRSLAEESSRMPALDRWVSRQGLNGHIGFVIFETDPSSEALASSRRPETPP